MTRAFKAHHIDICQQLGAHYDGVLANFKHVFRPLSANGPYHQAFLSPQKLTPGHRTGGLIAVANQQFARPSDRGSIKWVCACLKELVQVVLGNRLAINAPLSLLSPLEEFLLGGLERPPEEAILMS